MQLPGGTFQTEGKPVQKWSIGSGSVSDVFEENQGGLCSCRGVSKEGRKTGEVKETNILQGPVRCFKTVVQNGSR